MDFSHLLQATLTPVALISGVGLLLLSMVNRYNHAIDRIRVLLKDRRERTEEDYNRINLSISIIFGRCRMMRRAILCVASSIACSGAMVFVTALEGLFGIEMGWLKALFLVISVVLVVVASVFFVIEIGFSLKALSLEISD